MALAALSGDEQGILFVFVQPAILMVALPDELLLHIFRQACNPLEPRRSVALSSASHGLWALTQEGRQQLRADHEAAAALCRKVGLRSCKELREAKHVRWSNKGLSEDDLALLGTLGWVLPALVEEQLLDVEEQLLEQLFSSWLFLNELLPSTSQQPASTACSG